MKKILIVTVGLPCSGKSTWAKNCGLPVISSDQIRQVEYGKSYWRPGEKRIWDIAYKMIEVLFLSGCDRVVLDACNINRKRRDFWRKKSFFIDWEVKLFPFYTDLAVCLERAKKERDKIFQKIIVDMNLSQDLITEDEKNFWLDNKII